MSVSSTANALSTAKTNTTTGTSTASNSFSALSSNYETFLTLLTTQLKNQDPTQPTDTGEFTKQLVQYSQVEQQIQTNSKLEAIQTQLKNGQTDQALGYLGKTVEVQSNGIALQNGQVKMTISTDTAAASSTLQISDGKTGKAVRTISLTKSAGSQEVVWDGKDDSGKQLADGTFKAEVKAKDATGKAITGTIMSFGKVTGIDMTAGEPYLALGDMYITTTNVLSIKE